MIATAPPPPLVEDLAPVAEREICIEVTAEDIVLGEPCAHAYCPVARALLRLGFACIDVAVDDAYWYDDGQAWHARLPARVSDWILRFDSRILHKLSPPNVGPVTFTLLARPISACPADCWHPPAYY